MSRPAPLTVDQAAAALGCCTKIVLRHIRAGRIVAFNVGSGGRPSYRIDEQAIEAFKTGARVECQSRDSIETVKPASGHTISGFEVIDFAAMRARVIAGKQSASSRKSGVRRKPSRRKPPEPRP